MASAEDLRGLTPALQPFLASGRQVAERCVRALGSVQELETPGWVGSTSWC